MSRLPSRCPNCNMHYKDFRTGLTWRDAYESFWRPPEPTKNWVNKTPKNLKGRLWELKQALWAEHIEHCSEKEEEETQCGYTEY
jgi:hypothetical protein